MNKVVDLHMHVVPGIDDGSRNIDESLQMLKLASEQGVTDVFCTSHNGYSKNDGERYMTSFLELQKALEKAKINIKLFKGCEILCSVDYINEIIYNLNNKLFATLGNSKYVLAELYYDVEVSEALSIIKTFIKNGYKPIIAHVERYFNISAEMVKELIETGVLIQVNAFSFIDESDDEIRNKARKLLRNKTIHFIGSDAHRIDHRPPSLKSGVQYIIENTDKEYAHSVLSGNSSIIFKDSGIL